MALYLLNPSWSHLISKTGQQLAASVIDCCSCYSTSLSPALFPLPVHCCTIIPANEPSSVSLQSWRYPGATPVTVATHWHRPQPWRALRCVSRSAPEPSIQQPGGEEGGREGGREEGGGRGRKGGRDGGRDGGEVVNFNNYVHHKCMVLDGTWLLSSLTRMWSSISSARVMAS